MPTGAESAFFFGALIGTALGIGLSGIVWALFGDRPPRPLSSLTFEDRPRRPLSILTFDGLIHSEDLDQPDAVRPSLDLVELRPRQHPLAFSSWRRWGGL